MVYDNDNSIYLISEMSHENNESQFSQKRFHAQIRRWPFHLEADQAQLRNNVSNDCQMFRTEGKEN